MRTVILAFVLAVTSIVRIDAQLTAWSIDPLIKIFPDSTPSSDTQVIGEVARGEHASLQLVVRSDQAITALRAEASSLALESDGTRKLAARTPRYVGYVPIDRPIQSPPKDQLRQPPADFPDPLLEEPTIDVPAGQAQAIWITVPIPNDATAGVYRADVKITGTVEGKSATASVPVTIRVFDVTVRPQKLWVTNWWLMDPPYEPARRPIGTPEYWDLIRKYAENMADHRQNVVLIDLLNLVKFEPQSDGALGFDFSDFDRMIEIFIQTGTIGRIEGGHIGDRFGQDNFRAPFAAKIWRFADGKRELVKVEPTGEEADRFYSQFFPALVKHLKEKGWLDRYVQHLADEPVRQNVATYRNLVALARKYAPELRIIEACHSSALVGSIDIWVPMLDFYNKEYKHYLSRQKAGDEVWFYTCWKPQDEYANRFIEQPLIKTRLLHWINFRYGATGYLHWGYNWWTEEDPYKVLTVKYPGETYLPAGDAWIVYPGKDGPIDSIRFEAMRDGIADYELLCMLAERDPKAAEKLVNAHILDFDQYETEIERFRATRRQLLNLLSNQ